MPVEQRAHVVDRIDRDARHADIARDARMIGIIAAMGGKIEGDRQAHLPGGEIAPVEGVRIFRRGEAGILPDRPGLGHIHRGIGPAQIGRDAGPGVEEVERRDIARRVGRFDRKPSGVSHVAGDRG